MHVDSITNILSGMPFRDLDKDRANAEILVLQWMISGIVCINAVTIPLSIYSDMIKDRTDGKLNSIYTAPISRLTISSAYIISAWICSVIVCTITLAISEAYIIFKGGEAYSVITHLKILGLICANSFAYAALMYFFAVLVKSVGAWSSISTIIGTLVGFVGGIYIPISQFSDTIARVIKCLPVIYGTKLFRNIITFDAQSALFNNVPQEIINEYRLSVGTDLSVSGNLVGDLTCLFVLLGCGVLFTVLSAIIIKHVKKADR